MGGQRGALLVEALCALALAAFVAGSGAAIVTIAARLERRATHVDHALAAARSLHARLAGVSFARLPSCFDAGAGAASAALDTADGSAPPEWAQLVDMLPAGALRASLTGMGEGGVREPFGSARALRVTVEVTWRDGARRRALELFDVRF